MKKILIVRLITFMVLTFMVLSVAGLVFASDFPSKPIKLIVPWAPGGGTDTLARALAKFGKKHFGVPIVVQNIEGGMGAIALQRVKASKPTGYELVVASGYVGWMDKIRQFPVNFDDFTKIMSLNRDPAALTVAADAPWDTIEEFIEYAKKHPGEITIGHSGEGLVWHIAAASIADYFDLEFTYVPYNGAAPAIAAVMGGQIDAVTVSGAEVASQVMAGKLKCLGIMGAKRLEPLPNVPTFKELGYDIEVYTYRGLVGPKGIPEERVKKLYEGFTKIMQEEEFIKTMKNLGLGIYCLGPEEFSKFIEKQSAQALKSLKRLGLIK
ncbi:tripartite tricarboxylate transporter substrate binding protein [Anoxybacter fermentans]|nr:tripartite tricarboxylate transporter substrate binding protein [Anoxybacter fermentans]